MQTLKEAKEFLRAGWDKGCRCPACGHFVKRYKKTIYNVSAFALIKIYQLTQTLKSDDGWIHVTKEFAKHFQLVAPAYDYNQLERWGLIERRRPNEEKNKLSNGYFRITQKGIDFVQGKIKVQKYIWMYNNKVLQGQTNQETEQISIKDALERDNKFDYEELMTGLKDGDQGSLF